MKKFLNATLALMLVLGIGLTLAACGGHECTDADKNHKCDTCEAPMGEHADGDDEDHLCDYGCGWHECTDADKNHNAKGGDDISSANSPVRIFIVDTNEEIIVARKAQALLNQA